MRLSVLVFDIETEGGVIQVPGGADLINWLECTVNTCGVRAASHMPGAIVKGKLISRRLAEEAEFLDDLVQWIALSGVRKGDQLFTRYAGIDGGVKTRKVLTGRVVRDQLKLSATLENLNPNYFSSHSLGKGATTHLRAQGALDADIRDRGNYVAGSEVPRLTYDCSCASHGPLSSNSLLGGHKPEIADIKRHLPDNWNQQAAAHLGNSGEGDR